MANYGQPLSPTVLGRTWYCKTIWSLCWLHEQLIAMFLLLSLWFCFIAVNILVDHEELELAYDANIYIRWLLFSSVSCFFYDCHQAIVIHHSVATRSCCLRWWHWMMSTGVPWQPWVLICFFLDLWSCFLFLLLAATNERNHAVSPPNHKKLRAHFIIKSVLVSNVWHYYVHINLWNCNCDDEFIYENVYVKEVVLIMCMCSSVRAGGWAAWSGAPMYVLEDR